MTTNTPPTTVHASAVVVGDSAILIRGPSGSGKSRLAFDLILAGRSGVIPAATLVGDDRVRLWREGGQLIVSAATELQGLIEIRGLGIRRCEHVARASVGLVVDLAAADADRIPEPGALHTVINGIRLPRVPVGTGCQAFSLVVAALTTSPGSAADASPDICRKRFGNHISPTLATE